MIGARACGCHADQLPGGGGEIIFCPLHAAAPKLLAAGERILAWIDSGCDPSSKAIDDLRAVIAEAKEA